MSLHRLIGVACAVEAAALWIRPVQFGGPGVRSPQFVAAAPAQSAAVASSEAEGDDQAFVDAISEGGNTPGGGDPGAGLVTGERPR